MPAVPFSGVPTVAPGGQPQSRYVADVSEATFGGNVGAAIHGLGGQLQKTGNELFARGEAMQALYNQSEAQEATAKYMETAGKLHADYNTLQGKDAVAAYPGYIDGLKKARESIKNGLSNETSQKLFEGSSVGVMGSSIFNGAGHAATENKKYAIGSVESRIQSQTDLAATSDNPREVEAARGKLKGLSRNLADLKGLDEDSAAQQERTINSSLDYNTVQHLARTDPFAARTELEARKDGMTAKDYDRALTVVDNQTRAVGSVNIAKTVLAKHMGDDGKPDVPFSQIEAEAEAEAKRASPDDAIMHKHTVDALKGLYNQKVYADKQFRWDNTQTVAAAIQNGVKDIQQLRADPKVAQAIDNLPKADQLKIPAQINAYNAARDKVANQESLTRLTGLRNNDVESFLNLDPTDPALHLNQSQQRQVMGWQTEDKKNQNSDPRVGRALSWLRQARGGELAALGVYRRDNKSPDDYDHMTGTLQSALDLWQESHGKPAEYKDVVDTIGPQVIQSRNVPGAWWGTNKEPFFKPDVNSAEYKTFTAKTKQDVLEKGGIEPSTEQLDRAYTRMQLLKLYPAKAKSTDGK